MPRRGGQRPGQGSAVRAATIAGRGAQAVPFVVVAQRHFGRYPNHETDAESGAVVVRSGAEIQRQRDEEIARKAADLRWLDEGFAYAKQIGAKGILIDWQADPNFNNE